MNAKAAEEGEMSAVLLTLASALLFEELTLGALVKLIVDPKAHARCNAKRPGDDSRLPR